MKSQKDTLRVGLLDWRDVPIRLSIPNIEDLLAGQCDCHSETFLIEHTVVAEPWDIIVPDSRSIILHRESEVDCAIRN